MEDHFMNEDEIMNPEKSAEEEQPKRRGGRRTKAVNAEMPENKPQQVYFQFQDTELEVGELLEAARAKFREEKKRTAIKDLKLYIKPEEKAAYYVINEKFAGKVDY